MSVTERRFSRVVPDTKIRVSCKGTPSVRAKVVEMTRVLTEMVRNQKKAA